MRHKVIEVRQEVFNHNEHEVSKRWAFEDGVCVFILSIAVLIMESEVCILSYVCHTNNPVFFFFFLDQEAVLSRQSLGEDSAEQLEGVLGL